MPDPDTTAASIDDRNRQSADAIKGEEATLHGPRGNVHSEADAPVDQDMPPPMPS